MDFHHLNLFLVVMILSAAYASDEAQPLMTVSFTEGPHVDAEGNLCAASGLNRRQGIPQQGDNKAGIFVISPKESC